MKHKRIPALVCLVLTAVLLPAFSRPAEAGAPTVTPSAWTRNPVRHHEKVTASYNGSG